jgi:hypothetical protein
VRSATRDAELTLFRPLFSVSYFFGS